MDFNQQIKKQQLKKQWQIVKAKQSLNFFKNIWQTRWKSYLQVMSIACSFLNFCLHVPLRYPFIL